MPDDIKQKVFPKDFLWGASVAGHQVEGGSHDQWTVWELENAAELAKTAKKRLHHVPVWDEIKRQAQNPANYISGKGVEHYQRYESDFDIAKKLNLNAFRFTIEWSRLEPEQGQWDEVAVEHYRDYIKQLRKRGIEPIPNIWHWTHPVWFEQKGGFKKRANLHFFNRFVRKVSAEYGKDLNYLITINEPNNYSALSYLIPDPASNHRWPPEEKSYRSFARVYWNLTTAHKRAYRVLKYDNPHLQVGIAAALANIQAKDPHDYLDTFSTKIMRYVWNWWFLKRIRKQQDFIGMNYYFTDYYDNFFKRVSPGAPVNDLGWYMEPEGLYPIMLRAWERFGKPIIITENGVADAKDQYRRWWIEETIVAMERAMSQGVDIRGYFHWSLLDNFEWALGWWPKFGLVEVDREKGMKRTVRESAKWFAERIKQLS